MRHSPTTPRLPVFLVLLLCHLCLAAQVVSGPAAPGAGDSLAPVVRNGVVYVSLPALWDRLGMRWQWDFFGQRLTLTKNNGRLVFTQDVPFYTADGVALQLSEPPVRIGGSLYLPAALAAEVLRPYVEGDLQWDQKSRSFAVSAADHTIQSVVCDKKQNGTLVTIALRDSLPFDYTYFHPNLILNFFGGTVDIQQIRSGKRVGVVDSVFAVQFKESAQVSLVLCRDVEDPQIDFVEDTRTVMVSLRPKTQTRKAKTEAVAAALPDQTLRTIVIDPGHGGKDPGAIGVSGVKEKDVVLGIALHLRDQLRKKSDLRVFMTREKDIFVPLAERTSYANQKQADLFLSVHADAVPGQKSRKETTRGYKVYFLSQAKNEDDKLVAMRENAVIELEERPQNYGNLQNILIDLAGNEYLRQSQDLCIFLDQQFGARLSRLQKLHLGVGQANFWVLNGAYMPSVLIEVGFLSHPKEEKMLAEKDFQKDMAVAIGEAVLEFRRKYETGL